MRIGHYMQIIDAPGGIATYIKQLVPAQSSAGHEIFLFDTHPIETKLVPEQHQAIVDNDQELCTKVNLFQLDVLHLHTSVSLVPPAGLPLVRTIHVHTPYCPSGSKYLENWSKPCDHSYSLGGCLWGHFVDHCGSVRPQVLRQEFQRCWQEMNSLEQIQVITNSQFVERQMLKTGYNPRLVENLYLPAPTVRDYHIFPNDTTPRFLFVGRITPQKGLSWLLKALSLVKKPVHLDIAGTGNRQQRDLLTTMIHCLKLQDRVTWHGWVNQDKVTELLRSARALIFPSLWHEPAGLVSLEAAAVGRAVIASRVGGIPEYIERLGNGLLVDVNNVEQLAQAIEKLADNWELAQTLGLRGREMAQKHFSMEDHLLKLTEIYESVATRNREHPTFALSINAQ